MTHLFGHALIFSWLVRSLISLFSSMEIRPYVHSDHDCIVIVLDFDWVQRGPGYWHFKNELLKGILFQAEIFGAIGRTGLTTFWIL